MRTCVTFALLCLATPATFAQEGAYGALRGTFSAEVPLAVDRAKVDRAWEESGFRVITTELSPATLIETRELRLRFFSGLSNWGLGAPTRLAVPCVDTVRVLSIGDRMDGAEQTEAWLLAWFAQAEGWTQFDVPWLIVLQHKATRIELDKDGLALTFAGPAGSVASMPLYGAFKPPVSGGDVLAAQGLESPGLTTWTWYQGLPADVIQRCRWWSETLREFPIDVRETFSVDRRRDALTLRQEFTFRTIEDDFGTKHRRFGPLSPSLGLAWLEGGFPMRVSAPVLDPQLFTPYGPYVGVEDVAAYEIRFDVLQYVHETEAQQPANTERDPSVAQALEWIQQRMAQRYAGPTDQFLWDHGSAENACWQAMGDRFYPRALAYMTPEVAQRAKAQLRYTFANYVLKEENYTPMRGMLLLTGPGIGTWGGYDDAGKFSSNLLETIWCYAHYTGDWELIRERWPLIKRLFITPLEMSWKTFGREAIAEMGDEAAPPLYMARLAYQAGDADSYAYACYVFTRELVHLFVKNKGVEYFRNHQPVASMEPMAGHVYLTNLWGDTAGWQIDGPTYPAETGERQYMNRWVRFSSEDVARFLRDHLATEVRAQFDGLLTGSEGHSVRGTDTAHIAPSVERLRSLLLNEPPERLALLTPADQRPQGRDADGIAYFLSFIRTSTEPRHERLIPAGGDPSPYVVGIQRTCEPNWPVLVQTIQSSAGRGEETRAAWPVPSWSPWPPPAEADDMPASRRWPFGQIIPGDDAPPSACTTVDLSWVTQVLAYSP